MGLRPSWAECRHIAAYERVNALAQCTTEIDYCYFSRITVPIIGTNIFGRRKHSCTPIMRTKLSRDCITKYSNNLLTVCQITAYNSFRYDSNNILVLVVTFSIVHHVKCGSISFSLFFSSIRIAPISSVVLWLRK